MKSFRTLYGPVDLRQPREKVSVKSASRGSVTIDRGWLTGLQTNAGEYRKSVKQAMLIAAAEIKLNDSKDARVKEKFDIESLIGTIDRLKAGREEIVMPPAHNRVFLKKYQLREEKERHLMVKYSKKPCCARRERFFLFDNGELVVYRTRARAAKLTGDVSALKDARVVYEERIPGTRQLPRFEEGYTDRLRVDLQKRAQIGKSPVYLYPKTKAQLKAWMRAFQISRVTVLENDRLALKVALTRACTRSFSMGYELLVSYYKEWHLTKAAILSFSMRLQRVDLAKGWNNLRLLGRKLSLEQDLKEQQRLFALHYLEAKAKTTHGRRFERLDVREQTISRVQQKFRELRETKIFERTYPIGPNIKTRMAYIRNGIAANVALETLTDDQVMSLSFQEAAGLEAWQNFKQLLRTKNPTYSEECRRTSSVDVRISDNYQRLCFYAHEEDARLSQFSKTKSSAYINVDRISSVVLHSAPCLGSRSLNPDGDAGVWCTVYGPRVSWSKTNVKVDKWATTSSMSKNSYHSRNSGKNTTVYQSIESDGLIVPKGLSDPVSYSCDVNWVSVWLTGGSANLSKYNFKGASVFYVQFHLLGWNFSSKRCKPGAVFEFPKIEATIPVPRTDVAEHRKRVLETSQLSVELFQVNEKGVTVLDLIGSAPLSEFTNGLQELRLVPPSSKTADRGTNTLSVKVESAIYDWDEGRHKVSGCVSPEFVGGGTTTSLYTSHRAAWYDSLISPESFNPEHVANFVELRLHGLQLPPGPSDGEKMEMYSVQASIGGVSIMSPARHRPKPIWGKILGSMNADPSVIKFHDIQLCLPLAPGCWKANRDERPMLDIKIIRSYHQEKLPINYEQFIDRGSSGSEKVSAQAPPAEDTNYHCRVSLSGMFVDQLKNISAFLGKDKVTVIDAFYNMQANMQGAQGDAVINMEVGLRDRDYVRGSMGVHGAPRGLCVGDKVMLLCEEPVTYPQDPKEWRRRFCQGKWDPSKKEWPGGKMPLRVPCTNTEWMHSGFHEIYTGQMAKQVYHYREIPNMCNDIVAHQFVMPVSEVEFNNTGRPGIWPRILDNLSAESKEKKIPAAPQRKIVTHLTHIKRQVPCILLAMYADGTCDVEVASEFMEQWRMEKLRQYSLPGQVVLSDNVSTVRHGGMRTGIGGKAAKSIDARLPPRKRAVLRKVPSADLVACHAASISVYDASFKDITDVLNAPAPTPEFCVENGEVFRNETFSIPAGPLPPDVSPGACQYEWCLHFRAANDVALHQFVTSLRQCVRTDQTNQAAKIQDYHSRAHEQLIKMQLPKHMTTGGSLEVILVEARRLRPPAFRSTFTAQAEKLKESSLFHKGPLKEGALKNLAGTVATDGPKSRSTPDGHNIRTFVEFRMINPSHATEWERITKGNEGNYEIISYKGQQFQTSPIVDGTDSPSWALQPQCAKSGGYTFKTGQIDPAKLPHVNLDFTVKWAGGPISSYIGGCQVPVFEDNFLCDPEKPFKNLWLPLGIVEQVNDTDEKRTVYFPPFGEINIMTRWLPAEKMYLPPDQQPLSMRQLVMKELWPRMLAQRIREPLYDLEVQYLSYNPNIVKKGLSESPCDYFSRHVEELHNMLPYLTCLEQRQENAWFDFMMSVKREEGRDVRLHLLRNKWAEKLPNGKPHPRLIEFQELIKNGIPAIMREQLWIDITTASSQMEKHVESGPDLMLSANKVYQTFLEAANMQKSEAQLQLREDVYNFFSFESSSPARADLQDFLFVRLKKAQNVCSALLAFPDSSIVYCESLLMLAFYLLLPCGERVPEFQLYYDSDWQTRLDESLKSAGIQEGTQAYINDHGNLKVFDCEGKRADIFHASPPTEDMFPLTFVDDSPKTFAESSVFWVMHTLIGSSPTAGLRDYFGPAKASGRDDAHLWAGGGVINDVELLECLLAFHDQELFMQLTAVGFQLNMVFCGCFSRLFATFLPTASVFRLWDTLFSQLVLPDKEKPSRSCLISLAYGILHSKRGDLLLCQSVKEVTSVLTGAMGSMHDVRTIPDIIEAADALLWSGLFLPRVMNLLESREEAFKILHMTTQEQNHILTTLLHNQKLGKLPRRREHVDTGRNGVTTKEVITSIKPILYEVLISDVRNEAAATQNSPAPASVPRLTEVQPLYWTMHRPMPLASQALSSGIVAQAMKYIERSYRTWSNSHMGTFLEANVNHSFPRLVGPPQSLILECGTKPETNVPDIPSPEPMLPTGSECCPVDQNAMEEALGYEIPSWSTSTHLLWKSFANNREMQLRVLKATGRKAPVVDFGFGKLLQSFLAPSPVSGTPSAECVSINEMFIAFVCCSKGTVGEKASALFHVFSQPSAPVNAYHQIPTSPLVRVLAKAEEEAEQAGKSISPPEPEVEQNCALHFQILENRVHGHHNVPLGDVYIQSLGPYVGNNPDEAETHIFNIFGNPQLGPEGASRQSRSQPRTAATSSPGGVPNEKQNLGELRMAITWIPASPSVMTKGQLCIRVNSVSFHRAFDDEPFRKNPWIKVSTVKDGKQIEIRRWDPRGLLGHSDEHTSLFQHGPFGGHLVFEPTMREMPGTRNRLHKLRHHGENQGWFADKQEWVWNEIWGKQFSVPDHMFEEKHLKLAGSSHALDLAAVRVIVQCILQRVMLNFSNRQAILFADSVFNRQGVVPGILEAVITPEDSSLRALASPSTDAESSGLSMIKSKASRNCFVTSQIVLEHERQVAENGGVLNLFYEPFYKDNGGCSLGKMNISCPFGGQRTLWIRFVRAGDGERCLHGTPISAGGDVIWDDEDHPAEVPFDLGRRCSHTVLTHEEFVSCMLKSPLLGESLRCMASSEVEQEPRRPVQLDVTILDPHHEEDFAEVEEAEHVQQSILLEVYDHIGLSHGYMGEVWLPALNKMSKQMKQYVLPVKPPDFSEDAEQGPSRPLGAKDAFTKGPNSDARRKEITGDLILKASWVYPAYEIDNEGKCALIAIPADKEKHPTIDANDPANRGKVEEKRHTGMLTLQLERAQMLRKVDLTAIRECDPQVHMWIRNDAMDEGHGRWHKRPMYRSTTVRNNRNPVWNEKAVSFEILQGDFEARFPPQDNTWFEAAQKMTRSRRAQRRIDESRQAKAVTKKFGGNGLQVKFGTKRVGEDGCNHGVEVYMSDSIRDFKDKLTLACAQEMNYWKQRQGPTHENVSRYSDITIGVISLVMIYVPPPKVVRLASEGLQQGDEYKFQYEMSLLDPSNWQPLEPMQSFEGYSHKYHFGTGGEPPKIQVLEATESYKLTNRRYKAFEEGRQRQSLTDQNDSEKCFGWAQFEHEQDGRSIEWRPAMISKFDPRSAVLKVPAEPATASASPSAPTSKYQVSWLFPKVKVSSSGKSMPKVGQTKQSANTDARDLDALSMERTLVMDASKVMLAPRNPKIAVWIHPRHQEVLQQAKGLRVIGKSDFEIEATLQKSLDDEWNSETAQAGTATEEAPRTKPPKITVDIIRNYLNAHHPEG